MRSVALPGLRVPTQEPIVQAGFQATVCFTAGETPKPTQALDVMDQAGLGVWRVSAVSSEPAAVQGKLIYGTSSSFQVDNLLLPLIAYVPGNCGLYLLPRGGLAPAADVTVNVSCKLVGGFSVPQVLRTFHDAAAGALTLPASGVRYRALTASVVAVEGVPVALAVNEVLHVTCPAVLSVGSGLLEHEL